MKNVRKAISIILFLTLILSSFTTMTFADAATYSYTSEATVLNSLGLFNGTSSGVFEPDLGGSLTREQGVTFLLRLLGKESEAQAMTDQEVTNDLSGYTDSAGISDWAKKYIAYAVNNNIVKGLTDNTLGSKTTLTGKQFSMLALRTLGYGNTSYEDSITAFTDLTATGGTPLVAKINPGGLTRDTAVSMMYSTLSVSPKGSEYSVIQTLVSNGAVSEAAAEGVGFAVDTATTDATSSTGSTDSSTHHHHDSDTDDTVVAKPTPSVSGGVYTTDKAITLSCGTAGSTIYYTMDDTTPSVTSIKYVAGSTITINDNVTLQAIAVADGKTNSNIMTEKYIRKILLVNVTHSTNVNLLTSGNWLPATSGDAITVTASGVSDLTYSIASGTVDKDGNPISANITVSGGNYYFTGHMFDTILVTVTIGSWRETFTVTIS